MTFRIKGLDPAPFRCLYGQPEAVLRRHGAQRFVADATPGFPDRVELRDAALGENVLLVNYTHQPEDTPYRASHAIFVREGAERPYDRVGEVPDPLRVRTISLRAFDGAHQMIDADLVGGEDLAAIITRFFDASAVQYLHAHYAKRGCFAARIDRA